MSKYSKAANYISNESTMASNIKQSQKYRMESNNNRQFKLRRDTSEKWQNNTVVQVPITHLLDFVQIYEWRQQTDYPIVSSKWKQVIINHKNIPNTHKHELAQQIHCNLNNQQFSLVYLSLQSVSPLATFFPLSFTHYLYALKESLVGFQRLLAIFGTFQIRQNMITVNKEGRVKVWISEHYDQNSKIGIDQSKIFVNEEQYMVQSIKDIFLQFASSNAIYRQFFKNMQGVNTFLQFFKYIEDFTSFQKVIVGKNILKKSHIANKRPLSPIINLKPIGRTPKFVLAGKKRIPELAFRQSLSKPRAFNFSELKTKETMINEGNQKLNGEEQIQEHKSKAGKIVKNNLYKVKSLNNLSCNYFVDQLQNNLERSIDRLFQQDLQFSQQQKHKNLMDLGRHVRQSFIIKQT